MDGTLSLYAVGSSSAPSATYPSANIDVGSGSTIGIFPSGTAQATVVDLSGVTPATHIYALPISYDTAYAATSAAQFVVGNQSGVVVDGTTLSGTPQFLSLGAAQSIAGGGGVAAIATAAGKIYVINPATQKVQNSFALTSSKVELSQDGTVLAAISDTVDAQYAIAPLSLSVFSLPAGSLTNTFTGTDVSTTFSLSGSGTLIETGPGVTAITGGTLLWPATTGLSSFLFSTAGNDFVTTATSISCAPATNFYNNYVLTNTIAGEPAGWIEQDHVLVNAYQRGDSACVYTFTSASIYDATGTLVTATTLPELKSIQPVSAQLVYSLDRNAIYSLTTGQAIWTGPSLSGYSTTGAVAGSYVVYPSGASVVATTY